MGVKFHVEVKGLNASLAPVLQQFVGSERIHKMRRGFSKAANRIKYYVKKEVAKHKRSGLLYRNVSYRIKYYRARDTIVAIVGIRSKQSEVYKGRNQITHNYAKFLFTGRGEAKQMLRQRPFHKRNPNQDAPKIWPRTSGPQSPKINLQSVIDANRETILAAAVQGAILAEWSGP